MAGIASLVKLSLANNDFRTVPAEIGQLKNLQYLNLSQNRLEGLPKEGGVLSELQVLHLEYNYVTQLPHELIQLTRFVLKCERTDNVDYTHYISTTMS